MQIRCKIGAVWWRNQQTDKKERGRMLNENVFSRYTIDQDSEIAAEIERCRGEGSYIYAVRHPQTQLIKIGYSASVQQRLFALRHEYSARLELIATFPGSRKLERLLHKKFHYYRETKRPDFLMDGPREWFRPVDEIFSLLQLFNEPGIFSIANSQNSSFAKSKTT
jgi:hypothetical protein